MDPLQILIIIQIFLSVVVTIVGWFAKTLYDKVSNLNERVLSLSDKYVQKSDYKTDTAAILAVAAVSQTDIKSAVFRIENKLDTKSDKPI